MTREQALRSYTLDAAFGAFEEKTKGSLNLENLRTSPFLRKT